MGQLHSRKGWAVGAGGYGETRKLDEREYEEFEFDDGERRVRVAYGVTTLAGCFFFVIFEPGFLFYFYFICCKVVGRA